MELQAQFVRLLADPRFGFVVGVLVLVLGWKMTATWGNAMLFVAWAVIVVSTYRSNLVAGSDRTPRILWTCAVASVSALLIYYTLWTGLSRERLGFAGFLYKPDFSYEYCKESNAFTFTRKEK